MSALFARSKRAEGKQAIRSFFTFRLRPVTRIPSMAGAILGGRVVHHQNVEWQWPRRWEAVERYCSACFFSDELPVVPYDTAPFPCVAPDDFVLYRDEQYRQPEFP